LRVGEVGITEVTEYDLFGVLGRVVRSADEGPAAELLPVLQ
jgi:hypothetical protein